MGRVCNAPAHRACDPCARNNKAGCHSVGRVSSAPALPRGSSADPIHRLCPACRKRYLLAVQRQKDACDALYRDLSAGQRPRVRRGVTGVGQEKILRYCREAAHVYISRPRSWLDARRAGRKWIRGDLFAMRQIHCSGPSVLQRPGTPSL